jgi:hypothetical protein
VINSGCAKRRIAPDRSASPGTPGRRCAAPWSPPCVRFRVPARAAAPLPAATARSPRSARPAHGPRPAAPARADQDALLLQFLPLQPPQLDLGGLNLDRMDRCCSGVRRRLPAAVPAWPGPAPGAGRSRASDPSCSCATSRLICAARPSPISASPWILPSEIHCDTRPGRNAGDRAS